MRVLFCIFCISTFGLRSAFSQPDICDRKNTEKSDRSCSSQIFGDADTTKCHIEHFPPNSEECKSMSFGTISTHYNIADVTIRPYLLPREMRTDLTPLPRAVVSMIISNIKFKTMKFRFKSLSKQHLENHCGNIMLSNEMKVNNQSKLIYNCFNQWVDQNILSHFLDFEASDAMVVYRGQYYFDIPSVKMLDESSTEEEWAPFIYVELLTDTMKLHIVPPPPQLNIMGYQIKIIKESDKGTYVDKDTIVKLVNRTDEVTYDCSLMTNGSYRFSVTPLHRKCVNGMGQCQTVDSPMYKYELTSLSPHVIFSLIAIAILISLLIACCFCKSHRKRNMIVKYTQRFQQPKVLINYSQTNRRYSECIDSLIKYLQDVCGIDVRHQQDIYKTSHADHMRWADEEFETADFILNFIGPSNRYKDDSTPNHYVDSYILNKVKANLYKRKPKDFSHVFFFENSKDHIPHGLTCEKIFQLPTDFDKLIRHLMNNNMVPEDDLHRQYKEEFLNNLVKYHENDV